MFDLPGDARSVEIAFTMLALAMPDVIDDDERDHLKRRIFELEHEISCNDPEFECLYRIGGR